MKRYSLYRYKLSKYLQKKTMTILENLDFYQIEKGRGEVIFYY